MSSARSATVTWNASTNSRSKNVINDKNMSRASIRAGSGSTASNIRTRSKPSVSRSRSKGDKANKDKDKPTRTPTITTTTVAVASENNNANAGGGVGPGADSGADKKVPGAGSASVAPLPQSSPSVPVPVSVPAVVKRDLYCWGCHTEGPQVKCKSCPRSYHQRCVESMGESYPPPLYLQHNSNPNFMEECPECILAKNTAFTNMKNVPEKELREIFTCIARNVGDGLFWPNPFSCLEDKTSNYKDVVSKVVDFTKLETLAFQGKFTTLEGFYGETKWILHNTFIVEGRLSREFEWAQALMEICKQECSFANECPECYLREQDKEHDHHWFLRPCVRQPHLLAWARPSSSSRYWPVKIMEWKEAEGRLTVHSFGDYQRFEVSSSKCYLYTETPPRSKSRHRQEEIKDEDVYRRAIAGMKSHIKRLEKVVGSVELANGGASLKRSTLEMAQRMLFPDLVARKQIREPGDT